MGRWLEGEMREGSEGVTISLGDEGGERTGRRGRAEL